MFKTQSLTIKTATLADLSVVEELLRKSYPVLLKPDYKPSVLTMALPMITKANPRLLRSASYYIVRDSEGVAVGVGDWTWISPMGGAGRNDLAHVRHVATDHRRTRQGIGRKLMSHIYQRAYDAGARRMDCVSTVTAEPFYAAMGFQRIGGVELSLAPGIRFPATQMHIVLQ